jgi:hypothetical protein
MSPGDREAGIEPKLVQALAHEVPLFAPLVAVLSMYHVAAFTCRVINPNIKDVIVFLIDP